MNPTKLYGGKKINLDLNFQCKACGLAQETRTAFCASVSGKVYNESFCANHPVPELTRECNETKCEFQWFTSQWSKCSVECGKGVQTRNVHCAQFDNDVITPTTDESKCSGEEKPEASKECDTGKECPGQWFAGPWKEVSFIFSKLPKFSLGRKVNFSLSLSGNCSAANHAAVERNPARFCVSQTVKRSTPKNVMKTASLSRMKNATKNRASKMN